MTGNAAGTARGRADTLRLRVFSALLGLPLVVASVWLGGPLLFIFGTAIALAGLWEFRNVTARIGTLSVIGAGAAAVGFMVAAWRGEALAPVVAVAIVAGGLLWHLGRHLLLAETSSGLINWALTVVAAFYPGGLLSYGLLVRGMPDGRAWLLVVVLAVFASDIGAYFAGRTLGRHKLAPKVSPGKTWEGSVGGLVASTVAMLALTWTFRLPVAPIMAAGAGAAISLLAQAGDLSESFLKRAGGVKDAGWLVPGHGGILDRLDSVVLVLPAAYYGLVWLT